MRRAVRLGIGFGLLAWSLVCFPYAIIKYVNTKEMWILILGLFAGSLSFISSLLFLLFLKDDKSIETTPKQIHVEPKNKEYKPKKNKRVKKPFISEKEWEELEEEDEETMYIEEIVEDD